MKIIKRKDRNHFELRPNNNRKWAIPLQVTTCVGVIAKQQQLEIIKDVHEGQSTNTKARLIIEAEIQLIQTFPRASFGIEFIRMLGLTLKSPRQI